MPQAEARFVPTGTLASKSIDLDGFANESAWTTAPLLGGFTQTDPHPGGRPSEETFVRVLRGQDALYFSIDARYEDVGDLRGLLTQRDLWSASDWVEIWLNPQNDSQTGYRFAVNARGVQLDARFSQGGEAQDVDWNAVWSSAVVRTERGWSAEVRVPFSQLRYNAAATDFGVQFVRYLAKKNETSHFNPLPRGTARPLLHLARLKDLGTLPTDGGLSVKPYGLFRLEEAAGASSWTPRMGGEALYQPGGSTTIAATLFPDFGQVEQDPSQLNLSAFEIFQAERRQFFLDGRENVLVPLAHRNFFNEQLYYSRRIGARPTTDFGVSDDHFTQYPNETTIAGAAKTITRTQKGLSTSLLTAVTEREIAEFDPGGGLTRRPVASPTSYNVGRVAQQLQGGKGSIGVSGTHVERFLEPELETEQIRRASAGAADFDLRFDDIGLKGQVAASTLHGSPEAVDAVQRSATNNRHRIDARHIDYDPEATDLTGYSVALQGGKFDGNPWRATWGGRLRSPGFNTNDLGFLRLADQELWEMFVQYRFNEPVKAYRFAAVESSSWFEKSYGPEVTSAGVSVHSSMQLNNNWWLWAGTLRRPQTLDTRLLRGGPAILVPGASGGWMGVRTDERKPLDIELSSNWDWANEHSFSRMMVSLGAYARPTSSFSFSLAPSFEARETDRQYVETLAESDGDVYYLGHLDQETYSLTLRASWALALGLTLRVYAMPFLSAGRYSQFYRVTDPRADRYEDRASEAEYNGDDRFISSQLRSSVVLRWDHTPGSSAYIVWTHEQGESTSDTGSVNPAEQAKALLRSDATDVVMLKWDYFLAL